MKDAGACLTPYSNSHNAHPDACPQQLWRDSLGQQQWESNCCASVANESLTLAQLCCCDPPLFPFLTEKHL